MKTYIGTKIVHATPMNRGAYVAMRGWKLPEDENGDDEGYLVEYTDGGKPNLDTHKGYVTWSPKSVFEQSYNVVLLPYQRRVIDEKKELDMRISSLRAFLDSDNSEGVPAAEKGRLGRQLTTMILYAEVLDERIGAFE